jgi:uncharacterized protein
MKSEPLLCFSLVALALAVHLDGVPAAFAAGENAPVNGGVSAEATEPAASSYARGIKLLRGDGVAKDEKQAFALIQRAADQNHAEAIGALGYFYSAGVVVEKDEAKARHYFELGAAQGSATAQLNLGRLMVLGRGGAKDGPGGTAWIEKAIAQGSLEATLNLGEIYYFGDHADGTPDYRKAYDVLIGPAESGNARAQNIVGVILRDGRFGPADAASARKWFEKAAAQGEPKACSNLGHLMGLDAADREVRIEALKWLLVARDLKETTSFTTLQDNATRLSAEEMQVAQARADEVKKTFPSRR